MGSRKRLAAQLRKDNVKLQVSSKLHNCPSSPRKMRLVVDMIRGEKIDKALFILKYSKKQASKMLEKLLLSTISNWQNKNTSEDIEDSDLFIKEIRVDNGKSLKRLKPAPQGRGHRIKKRSNHITIIVDKKINKIHGTKNRSYK